MTTKLNQAVLGLDGTELKDADGPVMLGKLLAIKLAEDNKGDALKFFSWAQKFYAGEEVDLDKSDLTTLKEFVKANQSMTNLAKAQILETFE